MFPQSCYLASLCVFPLQERWGNFTESGPLVHVSTATAPKKTLGWGLRFSWRDWLNLEQDVTENPAEEEFTSQNPPSRTQTRNGTTTSAASMFTSILVVVVSSTKGEGHVTGSICVFVVD